jgi:hypothetical protein
MKSKFILFFILIFFYVENIQMVKAGNFKIDLQNMKIIDTLGKSF